jgi:hypothetical protein
MIYPVVSSALQTARPLNTAKLEHLLAIATAITDNAGQLFSKVMQDRILGVQTMLSYALTGEDSYVEIWLNNALSAIAAAHSNKCERCDCGACKVASLPT